MKKMILTATLALTTMTTAASADLWTGGKTAGLEPHGPDFTYQVPTKGLDVRVYEWTPVSNPNMTCLMAWSQTHPAGLQCFPKVEGLSRFSEVQQ